MFKQMAKIEVKKNGRDYSFPLPDGCNLGELVDVLFEMRAITVNEIQNAIEREKPKEEAKQVESEEAK